MKRTFTPWRMLFLLLAPVLAAGFMLVAMYVSDPWMFHHAWTPDGAMLVAPGPAVLIR